MKRFLMVMVLSILMLSSLVYGEEQSVDSDVLEMITHEVDVTNERIENYIEAHVNYSEGVLITYDKKIKFLNDYFSGKTRQYLTQLFTEKKDYLIDLIIDSLIKVTNAEAERMFYRAESFGVTVICDYTFVIIDTKEILIDPIRVVGG
ncbi:MAG: hypothetical protein JEZ08_10990 [Clostridiales bacterium]|nr:hypothetical protein [Clostridiales bacterium]